MYLVTMEKYIYVFNTPMCKREVIILENLEPEYIKNRLSWCQANNYRLGCIYKLADLGGSEWDEAHKAILKALEQ